MSQVTMLVVSYDHKTKKFSYDDDATDAWIREMFYPPSSTYCDVVGDHISDEHFRWAIINDLKKILEDQQEIL